jgi:concentrative nucleoside transporter, CNT family
MSSAVEQHQVPEYTAAHAAEEGRKSSPTTSTYDEKHDASRAADAVHDTRVAEDEVEVEAARNKRHTLYQRFRPLILGALAATILGWWISSTILKATRHRW